MTTLPIGDTIREENTHDKLEMSEARAVWPEVLAIYAVKVNSDLDEPHEVASMTPTNSLWPSHNLSWEISVENPIGVGTAFILMWNGVPALFPGVPTNADTLILASSPSLPAALSACNGSRSADNGWTELQYQPPA